ncbi:MAG TPA: diaminopimelate epimerase [Balneolaceae bacterium]|nr:diaminopimelate epimerase [Balneolaceae bacterium]
MEKLPFTKMHGAGNDFVIVDNRDTRISTEKLIALTPELCRRRFGVGADGLIALLPPSGTATDYTMFYRNADGSDAGMCGNGARCLALFAARAGLGEQLRFTVHETTYQAEVNSSEQYITLSFPMQIDVQEIDLPNEFPLFQAHAGTEHIVRKISPSDLANDEELKKEGRRLRYHERFNPPGTNVNFICGDDSSDEMQIKTYERGVEDLTLACGTGAIASAVVWHQIQNLNESTEAIKIQAEGGTLDVYFSYNSDEDVYSDIQLGGEAQFVFEGTYVL